MFLTPFCLINNFQNTLDKFRHLFRRSEAFTWQTIFQSAHSGQTFGKCAKWLQTVTKTEPYEIFVETQLFVDPAIACSLAVYSMHSQCVMGTHPHTSFQADFRDDSPERDASMDGCWSHQLVHPRSLHAHLLSIRAWCWGFLLGTDYLVRIGWLGEIHWATFIGRQGHWCYVWSLRNIERKTERQREKRTKRKKRQKERGVKNSVGVSPPVGRSFESEEDHFTISIERKGQQWVKYWRQLYVGQ